MYKFNGRPDGIGNRIEELIFLKTAHPYDPIEYFWNNSTCRNDRKYSIDFEMDGVTFINKRVEQNTKIDRHFDQEKILNASKTIKPKFEILFEETPIALHIRRGDKCHQYDKSECKMTLELSNKCIEHSIEILKNQKKPVFICSDDKSPINRYKPILEYSIIN